MPVIVALRDRVADRFLNLTCEENDAVAIRNFTNALLRVRDDMSNALVVNPEDFDLMSIASFDSETGEVYDNRVHCLVTAWQVLGSDDYKSGDFKKGTIDLDFTPPIEEF